MSINCYFFLKFFLKNNFFCNFDADSRSYEPFGKLTDVSVIAHSANNSLRRAKNGYQKWEIRRSWQHRKHGRNAYGI